MSDGNEGKDKKHKLMVLAALGVVYGDIGTSPLYAFRECFYGEHATTLNIANIYGVLSLIFWSLILIISIKYLLFIMRADNQGEGGILSLMHLVLPKKNKGVKYKFIFLIGLFGAALLYGDGILTPAISVLSAVEGLEIVAPHFEAYIVPVTIVILIGLFWLQSRGTSKVGKLFGPIMLVWFAVLAVLGAIQITENPQILLAANPYYAFQFLVSHGSISLFILGAVFLVVTGGEALYADMGHFGISPIRKAWFLIVLPGLLINYFGQGALLISNPDYAKNPFYFLAPEWALIPLIILAMFATIIASQAVISGAFSLTFQAVQLNYLPRMRIFHTSDVAQGQVYLPHINTLLLVATIAVVLIFRSSANLAVAYGIAITVTMVITDILAFYAMRKLWKWSFLVALSISILFLAIDISFLSANIIKFFQGGWFPLLIAVIIYVIFRYWIKGQKVLREKLSKFKTSLNTFIADFDKEKFNKTEGTAIFMTSDIKMAPIALQHNLKHNKVIHDQVILLQINFTNTPTVLSEDRMICDHLDSNFYRVIMKFGYLEKVRMNDIMKYWKSNDLLKNYAENPTFYLSRLSLLIDTKKPFSKMEYEIYSFMHKNSLDPTRYFYLPTDQVFEIGLQVKI